MSPWSVLLADEQATVALGGEVGGLIQAAGGALVFLQGGLGAGKTTFTRGVLQAFGHRGAVKSPTYTLVEPYELNGGAQVYHFDLYRLGDPEELEYMGIRDYFSSGVTCLVEWPARGEGFLPAADLLIELAVVTSPGGSPGRQASISAHSECGRNILGALQRAHSAAGKS
ncbi:MAG: tRNA (adenosine(37)-N6)-threonylcarbamoyltransferase complex ATPase subunit type 1 TsaE [Gammaproteobacteria bacterium]|nr:tRNA (adenosine(37)-N6)-threonylcarbamoyltransferase complex ATPase subunit type 1 TsaE [Gammaproteobacteria bacterium]